MGGALFLCFQVFDGHMGIHFHRQRGTFNSAWTGAVITLVATQFVGLFGFFPVKSAIDRDQRTGVGQLLAATPISNLQYTFGKALSNFAVLSLIILILAAAAIPLQLHLGEAGVDAGALFLPLLLIAWPMIALVAATAVLFETIEPLRGGFGNLLYFFFGILLILATHHIIPDPSGIEAFCQSMLSAVSAVDPAVKAGFGFGGNVRLISSAASSLRRRAQPKSTGRIARSRSSSQCPPDARRQFRRRASRKWPTASKRRNPGGQSASSLDKSQNILKPLYRLIDGMIARPVDNTFVLLDVVCCGSWYYKSKEQQRKVLKSHDMPIFL
jgi:hypothetical protein